MSVSYVYVLHCNGRFKIGFSALPNERMRTFRTAVSPDLTGHSCYEVPHSLAKEVESRAHELLSDHRQHGEWFSATEEQVEAAILTALHSLDLGLLRCDEQFLPRGRREAARKHAPCPPASTMIHVDTDLVLWAEALFEERPGGNERIGEFLRAAMIHECERRDPKGRQKPPKPGPKAKP